MQRKTSWVNNNSYAVLDCSNCENTGDCPHRGGFNYSEKEPCYRQACIELAKYEDKLESGELLTKDEHFQRCKEMYEQGKFDKEAQAIYTAGYGNVAQAVKEFAEWLKLEFYQEFEELMPSIISDKIDEHIKELYGGEE